MGHPGRLELAAPVGTLEAAEAAIRDYVLVGVHDHRAFGYLG